MEENTVLAFAAIKIQTEHLVQLSKEGITTDSFQTVLGNSVFSATSEDHTLNEATKLKMKTQKALNLPKGVIYPAPAKHVLPRRSSAATQSSGPEGTDERWEAFLRENISRKKISAIPGLGAAFTEAFKTYNKRMENGCQYIQIQHLLSKYLMLDCDDTEFKLWLREDVGVPSSRLVNTCSTAIKEWWDVHSRLRR